MNTWSDDRGFSYMNIFADMPRGQVNYSTVYPGVVKAWHRHRNQVDYWMVISGDARCATFDPETNKFETHFLGEHNPRVVAIPPGVWHGLTPVGNRPCGLLYWVTEKYDPAHPDEERAAFDAFDYDWSIDHH